MPKPFDAATKHLFEADPGTWMAYASVVPDGPLRVLDTDLSAVSAAADAVVRVDGPAPWVVHFEFQSSFDRTLVPRLLRYNVLLRERHELPVLSVVILLRSEADGSDLAGPFRIRLPNGDLCHEFHYRVVRAWEKPVEEILKGGLATLPLVALADVGQEEFPEIIRQINGRLSHEASPAEAVTLWTAFFILMGLRYPREFTRPFLEGVGAMLDLRESSVYQIILEEGRTQGLTEGEIKGMTRIVLQLGSERFGPPDPRITEEIRAIADPERLAHLTERLLKVSGWEELLATD